MNYVELYQTIQDYSENTESLFVTTIPTFVRQAEARIYNSVQIPSLRKNVVGTMTSGNNYLSCPSDYLSTYSLAVVNTDGSYTYLLNKDVNFLREAYPNPSVTGVPRYYALFGSQYSSPNELSFMLAPMPNQNYNAELHYFYYPISIVQGAINSYAQPFSGGSLYTNGLYTNVPLTGGSGSGATANILVVSQVVTAVSIVTPGNFYAIGDVLTANSSYVGGSGSGFYITISAVDNANGTSWLGDNYDPALLYGAMREAMLFMKGEQDLVSYYEQKYQEAMQQLNRLGTGLERGDAYRDGQAKLKVTA